MNIESLIIFPILLSQIDISNGVGTDTGMNMQTHRVSNALQFPQEISLEQIPQNNTRIKLFAKASRIELFQQAFCEFLIVSMCITNLHVWTQSDHNLLSNHNFHFDTIDVAAILKVRKPIAKLIKTDVNRYSWKKFIIMQYLEV